MKDDQLANNILKLVGGKDNVNSLIHCVTRLRFKLKNESLAQTDDIKDLEGVMTVVKSGGQYQVVIGDKVTEIYNLITPQLNASAIESDDDSKSDAKEKTSIWNAAVQLLSGLFMPILGPLAAAGVLKGLLALCTTVGWLTTKSGTYMILYAASDAIFYFLPIILGFSAGKVFKTNSYMGAMIGAALVYPNLVSAYTAGSHLTFFGIPVVLMNYTQTLIPIIAAVYVLSVLEKFLNRIIPRQVKGILVPLFCLIIVVPLTFLIVGPITSTLSTWLANAVLALYHLFPAGAGFVLAGIWQLAVLLGLHWAFIPIFLNNIATKGYDPINAMLFCTVFAQAGAALAMAIKAKDTKFKELATTAFISGFMGITEPIIYGVTIPHKKSFAMASIASAFGGGIAGAAESKMFGGFAPGGIFGIPMFIGKSGIDVGFIGFLISLIVGFIGALVLTLIFVPGVEAQAQEDTKDVVLISNDFEITAPLSGQAELLSNVKDDVFSKGLMGPGIAIIPDKGEVVAPFDGTVVSVFPTKHALGLRSDSGIEVLIHIGLDTVNLKGQYFETTLKSQQHFSRGEKLETFDLKAIKNAGYDVTVPIIVTNKDEFKKTRIINDTGEIRAGDLIIEAQADELESTDVADNNALI